ncbi:hypothetical protein BDV96DRAFT_83619 [Lophiotrema nucula]|uniref:2EXR domain-containing protein n=1 Tax=Lophiotrema nucula TaxID=690887 RepID=A0A6A5Z8I9_9PLEO|nr:hypothetical protein BDV96DRAFT_83619 [Lophiotrema nucula]
MGASHSQATRPREAYETIFGAQWTVATIKPKDDLPQSISRYHFLELPTELRIMIYEELLVVGKVFYEVEEDNVKNGKRYRGWKLFRKPEVQLLRVCKQIHEEAEPVYLSWNLFVLPVQFDTFRPFQNHYHYSPPLRGCDPSQRYIFSTAGLSCIKNISFAIDQKLCEKVES